MTILERAVSDLADALDALEAQIGDRLRTAADGDETTASFARQAMTARDNAEHASEELADVISELRTLLNREGAK